MRCIHFLDTDGFAGTERHLLVLVRLLRGHGVDATIGCLGRSLLENAAADQGIPTHSLGRRPGPSTLLAVLRLVRRCRPTLIHSHNGRTQLAEAVAHRITGTPLFATQHFLDPRYTTYRGLKRVAANAAHAWVNRQVTRFIAVSEAARSAMLSREHLQCGRIVTVPNGIEPLVRPPVDQLGRVRVELGVSADAPMIVTVARLSPDKGTADLIYALPRVRESLPPRS